jgi:hypothetical protein
VPAPLFQRLLGPAFDTLPRALRAVHDARTPKTFHGACDVERGRSPLVALIAAVMGLPRTGAEVPLAVTIEADAELERWQRAFAGRPLRSTLRARNDALEERMGPMRFAFTIAVVDGAIRWTLAGVRWVFLPLPVAWFSGVAAREWAEDGRYRFDVRATLPVLGLLVHYRGWLEVS